MRGRLDQRVVEVNGHRLPSRVVTALLNTAGKLPIGGHALIKGDRGGLRRGVRRHAVDAWLMVEDRLDYRLLARAQESADVKDHRY